MTGPTIPDRQFNFMHVLTEHARTQPQAVALQISERVLSYQMLEDSVMHAADWLCQQGITSKEIVALQMREPVSLVLAMLGLMRLGATPMPLSTSATNHQVEDFVKEAGAQRLLVDAKTDSITGCTLLLFHESMLGKEVTTPNLTCDMPEAPCLLVAGSGSTGKPRLIPITHAQMRARTTIAAHVYKLQTGDRLLVGSPVNFSITIHLLLSALSAGITGLAWDQRGTFGEAVENLQPTLLHLSVLHGEQLLAHHKFNTAFNLTSIRMVSIGASTVSEALRRSLIIELGASLHIHYGTNETWTVAFAYPSDLDIAPGGVGRPPQSVMVEVIDSANQPLGPGQVGQVRVFSPGQISGYLDGTDPERFQEGWFYPGDLAEWTADGQLIHCGRADQMMITNGINIYPAEIERIICTHPAVREVLAFPFADRIAQAVPVCAVVLNEGVTASSAEIQSYANERLGAKSPRVVVVLPSIPRNAQGKPVRTQLDEAVRQSLLKRSPLSTQKTTTGTHRRQRSRRIAFTFSPPTVAQAELIRPWRELLTASTTKGSGSNFVDTRPAGDAVTRWLAELLMIAAELLKIARVPIFDPLVPYSVKKLLTTTDANKESWQAVLEVPVLDHVPNQKPEPVMAAAIQSALKISAWVQQQNEGASDDEPTRAIFFAQVESEINTRLRKIAPTYGKSTWNVLAACHVLGVPWSDLGGGIYQLGWGAKACRIDRSTTVNESVMGMRISRDKAWTSRLLHSAGLPAAEHQMVRTLPEAMLAGNRIGWPVVIKPADAERGEGVSVDVLSTGLETAFTAARERSPSRKVLIERQVNGICHRLFINQNRLLYAVRRLPMGVYGDGSGNVEKLVNDAYASELKKAPWRRSPIKQIDELANNELIRQGLKPSSVPVAGQFVALRRIETTAWGGVDEDVTELIHPENLRVALEASRLCGLEVAGVDLISPDISQPWHSNGAIINEVNYAPLLGEGAISKDRIPQYIAQLVGGNGRIPVEVFVGDEAAVKAARQKASLLHQQGTTVVVTSHHWTCWGNAEELVLTVDGLYARTRALILSPKIEALILVVQNDELSYSGLPLEGVDNVMVVNTNLSGRDPQFSPVQKRQFMQRLADWMFNQSSHPT